MYIDFCQVTPTCMHAERNNGQRFHEFRLKDVCRMQFSAARMNKPSVRAPGNQGSYEAAEEDISRTFRGLQPRGICVRVIYFR